MNKEDNLKEKFKQALISTIKVISDEYRVETELKKNLSSKNYNFFELDNLSSKQDYIKLRAETDSEALKRKFSNKEIYKKIYQKILHVDRSMILQKKLGTNCWVQKCLKEYLKI